MHEYRNLTVLAPVALILALGATSAFAGTTGDEFQTMYTTLLDWATGYLGKAIAIAAFILGAGVGIARSSPIPALAGVVFAVMMVSMMVGTYTMKSANTTPASAGMGDERAMPTPAPRMNAAIAMALPR